MLEKGMTPFRNKFRLGYLIPEFPRQTHIFFWRECQELRNLGVEPVFLSTTQPNPDACPHSFREEATAQTHYVFPPPLSSLLHLLARPFGLIRALGYWRKMEGNGKQRLKNLGLLVCAAHLASWSRKNGISHIHVHSCGQSANLAALSQCLGGSTYSLTLHNEIGVHGPNQREKWSQARFGIVITQQLIQDVEQYVGQETPPLYVAPMGVDLKKFRRHKPYMPARIPGPFRIFSCGRLHPGKKVTVAVRAIGLLRKRGIDARLLIAGEDFDSGNLQFRRDIEAVVDELELNDYVQLPGTLSDDAIRDHLEEAHAFVLLSDWEALGVVIIEALAMGVPAVVTAVGGTTEIVTHGINGLNVPVEDVEATADALQTLYSHPEMAQRFSLQGRQTVEARFGSEQSSRAIVAGLREHSGAAIQVIKTQSEPTLPLLIEEEVEIA
jgi:colanic acid/amylovoran biosynthesis glycosyltransferase